MNTNPYGVMIMSTQPTNEQRVQYAQAAVAGYADAKGEPPELDGGLADLLTDLMHLCDDAGMDFDMAANTARMHYEAETA